MHIVVVGGGKIGRAITEQLAIEGHDVVLIDNNEARLTEAGNRGDIMTIYGNGAIRDIQVQAGVPESDLLIAVTGVDEVNLLCCLVAKKLGAKQTIARVRNPEYADELPLIRDDLGLSMAINPELAAAQDIFSVLRFPGVLTIEKFGKGRVQLAELKLSSASPLANTALNDINRKFKVKVLICAVRRGGETIIPNGDFILLPEDRISFICAPAETERFLGLAGILSHPPKNVIMVGAGRIAYYLARMLKTINVNPTIVESNAAKCRQFCESMPNCLVINGDGADRDLLTEEGIKRADAFVSVTGTDEVNILLSMYAHSQSVPKVVTKVSRISMIELVGDENLGSVVSPKDIVASQVIRYVRAMENSGEGNNVETLYRIVDGTVEALEFIARGKEPGILDVPFKELHTKNDLLVCSIIRNGKVIIPGGNDSIHIGDHVIVVTTNKRLSELHDILA